MLDTNLDRRVLRATPVEIEPTLADRLSHLFELPGSLSSRWLAMEGLRCLAILLVFFVHYTALIRPHLGPITGSRLIDAIWSAGMTGVDLFFILSGILIYRVCLSSRFEALSYAKRRVVRIYPTFLFVFAIYLAIMLAVPSRSKLYGVWERDSLYILWNLLLMPGLFSILPIVSVAWSLSYEAFFYITIPIVTQTLRLSHWPGLGRAALAAAIVATMIFWETLVSGGLHFRMIAFLAGIIVYEIGASAPTPSLLGINRQRAQDVLVLAFVGAMLVSFGFGQNTSFADVDGPRGNTLRYLALVLAFSCLVYRCLFGRSTAYTVFAWTPLRWLGNMSYSFYLFHGLALHAFFQALDSFAPGFEVGYAGYLLLLVPSLAFSIFTSALLYAYIEKPYSL